MPTFPERGLTLVEMLVAAGLGSILLLLFFMLLVPSMQYSGRETARAEVQQQSVLAFNAIENAIRGSASGGIAIFPKGTPGRPAGLAVQPLQDVDDLGRLVWQDQFTVFFWDSTSKKLHSKTWPPKIPGLTKSPVKGRPTAMIESDYIALLTSPNPSLRTLAYGVADFDAVHAGAFPALVPPLNLTMRLEREVAHQTETFVYTRTLSLRTP